MSISIWYRIPNRAGTHKLEVVCPDNDYGSNYTIAIAAAQKAWQQLKQGGFLLLTPKPR